MQELARADDLPSVYAVLDGVTEHVETDQPCMQCVAGCSECCNQQVLAGFAEWTQLLRWIHRHLSVAERRAIVARAEAVLADADGAVATLMQAANADPESPAYAAALNAALENHHTPCPFLVAGRCSVYPARPAICRGYGRMMRTADEAFYCDFILEQMRRATGHHVDRLELPVFQPYHHRALGGETGALDDVNALAIWILAHRAPDGGLVPDARVIRPGRGYPVIDATWSYDAGA